MGKNNRYIQCANTGEVEVMGLMGDGVLGREKGCEEVS